ncbi:MAG: hypothetical protein WBX50_10545 [Candidatus Deferrimicrobiaceae bacterium]
MKIFISWSDETSHAIASILGDWIPSVIQAVETYVSPEDIRKGTRWVYDVSKELDQSSLGILCVVPGNMGAPWLNFEAGVLSKSLDVSKVIPLLIGVERSELDNGPLAQFPSSIFEKNDMYQILVTINEKTEKGRIGKERLRNTFDIWWPKLELDVESIGGKKRNEIQDANQPERTPDTDKPKKTPRQAVEAAKKSEAIKTQDTDKPVKSIAAKPAPEEIEIEMLNVLYDPPGYTPITADAVGYKLEISAQKAREHLDKLERNNYVREHLFVGRPKEYSLAPKGREYLTKHDLLKKRRDR